MLAPRRRGCCLGDMRNLLGKGRILSGIALNRCRWRGNCAHPDGAARQAHCPVLSLVHGSSIMVAKKKTAPKSTRQKTAKTVPSQKPATPRPVASSDPAQAAPPVPAARPAQLSALDAAARVLSESKQALTCPELIAAMAARGYWTSPAGRTPQATLHAALTREIKIKKDQSRFRKTERGKFALA